MAQSGEIDPKRRKLIRLLGGGVTFLSVAGLAACSDGGSESSASATPAEPESRPDPEPASAPPAGATEQPAANTLADTAQGGSGGDSPAAPQLSEDNPQAQALGYRHDSEAVDATRFPAHESGQACANCTLFAGQAGDDWGPCGIFPGNQVNAAGWCSAYSAKT